MNANKMNTTLEETKSKWDEAEEQIKDLEDRAVEITQTKYKKKKN